MSILYSYSNGNAHLTTFLIATLATLHNRINMRWSNLIVAQVFIVIILKPKHLTTPRWGLHVPKHVFKLHTSIHHYYVKNDPI